MDDEISELIQRCKDEDPNRGIPFADTLTNPPKTFRIRSRASTEFMARYCEIVSRKKGIYSHSYLSEIVNPNSRSTPLVVQGIIKFLHLPEVDVINYLVYSIAARYQKAILERLNVSHARSELIFVYLGRWNNNENSYHYRIQFPYCRIDQAEVYGPLREYVIMQLVSHSPLKYINTSPLNGWEQIIDAKPYQHLVMYGSRSDLSSEPLELVEVVSYIPMPQEEDYEDELKMQDFFTEHSYPPVQPRETLIEPKNHPFFKNGIPAMQPQPPSAAADFEWWLPVLLSVQYASGVVESLPQDNLTSSTILQHTPVPSKIDHSLRFASDFNIASELIDTCLKEHRAQTNFYFEDIGRALYNITAGKPEGMAKWLEFGERKGANLQKAEERWENFRGSHITLRTIMWYAREDSPSVFESWLVAFRHSDMIAACSCAHASVAKALYKTFCLDFAVGAMNSNGWYEFRDHRWVHIEKGYSFSIAVSDKFVKVFDKLQAEIARNKESEKDAANARELQTRISQINNLIFKLSDHRFKENVIAECMNYFYIPGFFDKIDNAPELVCTGNGVIQMNKGVKLFRTGKPEDYLTKSTGVPYDQGLSWSSLSVLQTCEWINQLMVVPALISTMQKTLGSFLYGGNLDKYLFVWTGPPDAGKSTFVRGICKALGDYAAKGDNGVLYNSKSGDGPTPSLARLRGVRALFYEELETTGAISAGFVKRTTGNDAFFARFLNQNGGEITPLFKTIFVCNDMPSFSTFEKALRERFFPEPFDSTWSDNAPEDPEECRRRRIFRKDKHFNSKLPQMARALLWLMAEWYEFYERDGLEKMKEIKDVATKYWAEQDFYQRFIGEKTVTFDSPTGQIPQNVYLDVQMAFTTFTPWFKTNYPTFKIPNIKQFIQGISQHLGNPANNVWYGVSLAGIGAY